MLRLTTIVLVVAALGAAGLVTSAHAGEAKPKSNLFARATVLSKNELSITIRHSEWGQKNAYQFAADHCASYGKVAVQTTSNMGLGPDTTTWVCQEVPKATEPSASAPAQQRSPPNL